MKIVVVGAGVIGVSSAWYLQRAGHEVTVLDRQAAPAQETSHANGGQISVSHAEPWANPHAPWQALRWLGKADAPLLFRLRADPALWRWSLAFLRECSARRTEHNIGAITRLAMYSRAQLQALRESLNLSYAERRCGILHYYTDKAHFAAAQSAASVMARHGCVRELLTPDEAVAIEPALADFSAHLVGADFSPADESGDARRFTERLAEHAAHAGVQFRYHASVSSLWTERQRVTGLRLSTGEHLTADLVVLAAGSYSPQLAAPLGLKLPIVPAKGYSATYQLGPDSVAPTVSLTDDAVKIVISRLDDRLRVAGTAEFSGYNLELNTRRCRLLSQRIDTLFPRLNPLGPPQYWTGLRPATPSNRPLIGASGIPGLYLNTGHGTLGWTMACGSAAALTDLIAGRQPAVQFPFLETAA